MYRLRLKLSALMAGSTAICLTLIPAVKAASITNGGFNADLSGWTVVNQPGASGSWFLTEGSLSVLGNQEILTPSEGNGYAHSAQTGATSQVLFQDISLESETEHRLSFNWFAQDWSNNFGDVGTLDFTDVGNQHLRVDLLSTDFSDWFGADASTEVLANILAPVAESSPVDSWNSLSFDLTPWAGQSVRLAFRQVDNQDYFNAGIDDVSIVSTPVVGVENSVVVDLSSESPQTVTESGVLAGLVVLGLLARKRSRENFA